MILPLRMKKVWITNEKTIGDRAVSRKAISSIIHVRVVELFEIIAKELGDFLNPEELGAGVVLTGGASRLPGIEQVASMVLGVPARKATFPSEIGKDLAQPEKRDRSWTFALRVGGQPFAWSTKEQ